MIRIRRALSLVAVAALPLTLGAGVAHADGVSAGEDRLQLDTNTNLTDGDEFLVDVRVGSVDDSGDATGLRSRTTSSDVMDLENVQSDNRTISNDEGTDSTSGRAIVGFDSLRGLDDVDSDIDVVTIDRTDGSRNAEATDPDPVTGQSDGTANEEQYNQDAAFVLGQ